MFSYLRPSSRKSNIAPLVTPSSSQSRAYQADAFPVDNFDLRPLQRAPDQLSPSAISSNPPILPPIPRVASQHESNHKHVAEERGEAEEEPGFVEPKKAGSPILSTQLAKSDEAEHATVNQASIGQLADTPKVLVQPMAPVALQPDHHRQTRRFRPPPTTFEAMRSLTEPYMTQSKADPHGRAQVAQTLKAAPLHNSKPLHGGDSGSSHVRHSKTKLNLLNPMALLARRRSTQAVVEATIEKPHQRTPHVPAMAIPDDFDPRIRGKVVHDFSAPRQGRNQSSQEVGSTASQKDSQSYGARKLSPKVPSSTFEDESPSSSEREHTPIFKEHFDDDVQPAGPAKRRTSTFMYHISLNESQPSPDPSVLPPFARNLPSHLRTTTENPAKLPSSSSSSSSLPPSPPPELSLEVVPEKISTRYLSLDKSLPSSPPTSPPVKARSRASSTTDPSPQPAGHPKRFKSTSSRFSFDLAGVGSSAQEKLLEEKHRQQEDRRTRRRDDLRNSSTPSNTIDPDEIDNLSVDYDELDDEFDGLEEKIPGVNADADDMDPPTLHQPMQNLNLISPNKSSFASEDSPASTGITSPGTPRDSTGNSVGYDISKLPPSAYEKNQVTYEDSLEIDRAADKELVAAGHSTQSSSSLIPAVKDEVRLFEEHGSYEDDLYFDDGIIEDIEQGSENRFDESVFDEDTSRIYGLPLRDLKPQQENPNGEFIQTAEQLADSTRHPEDKVNDTVDISMAKSRDSFTDFNYNPRSSFSHTMGLTQDNLAAYHDALAFAATQAELNGKFIRQPTLRPESRDKPLDVPTAVPNQIHHGLGIDGGISDINDGFDLDDTLADDPIIAAANAEALENDDEGFYGREFGFYARASGASEAEYANGGYFGPRGVEGIGRSHSGRIHFQEPNLTPITERSEWSNRNSAISLAMLGYPAPPHSVGSQPSPGLAQLADMMHLEDDNNMSLSALMKLRRGAWGGSNGSLQSSSSGSPLAYVPGVSFPAVSSASAPMQHSNSNSSNLNMSPLAANSPHNLASSSYSLNSSNGFASSDGSESSPASATITFASQQAALPTAQSAAPVPVPVPVPVPMPVPVPVLQPNAMYMQPQRSDSPVKRSSMGPPPPPPPLQSQYKPKGHSRNSSSTSESVSYVMDKGGEWVLEKRRVSEGGTVEVLGREIVEGGRI
ncbi:MAG: hypothetical protein LQ351_001857 [Letrouitia transgressa]|nr:MAG: hypothetical protein LQ351_001857 [Letrouitia transgressa]